ncbi:MAG: DUF4867 family protein [Clostridiales bacterium]|nr:DUF4867 family protein [Clostridiales bacterium]
MVINSIFETSFAPYGIVHAGFDTAELLGALDKTPAPENVVYEPSVPELEALPAFQEFREKLYGGMPIQFGYCNGDNHALNCVEYHRDSEFGLAATDLILLLGRQQDIEPGAFRYDTSLIEAFMVPKGTLYEVYATTLHYAPISAGGKFRCLIVLPRHTNFPLAFDPGRDGEAKLLTHVNKWLIAHPESPEAKSGAHIGLVGDNLSLI